MVCKGIFRIVGGLAMAALLGATAIAQAGELKLAHFMSPKHSLHAGVFAPLGEELSKSSNGALTIRIYPAGELGKGPVQQYKRVIDHVADIGFGIQGYTATQFPRTMVAGLPGAASSNVDATRRMWAIYDQVLAPEYARVKVLGLWANDQAILISKDRPIRSRADLKGMKVRAPDAVGAKTLESWGAVPVNIEVTKVYTSFQTGVFDAILIGASAIRSFKLNEVGNYYTIGLPAMVSPQYLLMNLDAWNALSAADKAMLEKATGRALSTRAATLYQKAGDGSVAAVRKAGKEIIQLGTQETADLRRAAESVYVDYVATAAKDGVDVKPALAAFEKAGN